MDLDADECVVILVAEHIPAQYLFRGVYDCELLHAAFLRQGKAMIATYVWIRIIP